MENPAGHVPSWSDGANDELPVFWQSLQEIDVFVEDQSLENFYRDLLNRLMPDGRRIERVFGLKGREAVLARCAGHDFSQRPALFVVDGDLHWVRDDEALPAGAFRIPAYCIENLLLDEAAVVVVTYRSNGGKRTREDLRARLDWPAWRDRDVQSLVVLFAAYAVAARLGYGRPTVRNGLHRCLSKTTGAAPMLDVSKVNRMVGEIECELRAANPSASVRAAWAQVAARVRALPERGHVVSAKDFLMPLLLMRMPVPRGQVPSIDNFRIQLAELCSIDRLSELGDAVRRAVAGTSAGETLGPAKGQTPDVNACGG